VAPLAAAAAVLLPVLGLGPAGAAPGSPPATAIAGLDTIPLPSPEFAQPVAVAAAPLGRLYVADVGRGSVVRLDGRGRLQFEFEIPPRQVGLQPVDLAVTGFQVYVLDAAASALLRYSDAGSFLDVLDTYRDAGRDLPGAVAVDATGRVLLADAARHVVRLLDESQRGETLVGGFGARPGELSRPAGVAFAPGGAFWVADAGNARLQRFSGVGNFVAAVHDSLGEPRALAVSAAGDLVVADMRRRSVHLFGADGAHCCELGLGGSRPLDVAVVGDTVWVLTSEPAALLRLRVLRGG
jgi:DNA-binding beta-propeller fold protein YncE